MSTEDRRRALRAEVAKQRAELSALDCQRATARDKLNRLETEFAALDDPRLGNRPGSAGPGRAGR